MYFLVKVRFQSFCFIYTKKHATPQRVCGVQWLRSQSTTSVLTLMPVAICLASSSPRPIPLNKTSFVIRHTLQFSTVGTVMFYYHPNNSYNHENRCSRKSGSSFEIFLEVAKISIVGDVNRSNVRNLINILLL